MGSLRTIQMLFVGTREEALLPLPSYVAMPLLQYFAQRLDPEPIAVWHAATTAALSAWAGIDTLPRSLQGHLLESSTLTRFEEDVSALRLRNFSWPQIRGMSSDLSAPALTALREHLAYDRDSGPLLSRLGLLSDNWPKDLWKGGTSDNFLATLCHFADRFGAFRELFHFARPGSAGASVAKIFDRYHEIFMRGGVGSRGR
jgi:hypothetical protein